MKSFLPLILCAFSIFPLLVSAQIIESTGTSTADTATSTATGTAQSLSEQLSPAALSDSKDVTQPEQIEEKVAILQLLETRLVDQPNILNFFAYWVQQAIFLGVPANTIALILLTPVLAMLVAFFRVVLGLQTLELLVPIALAFAFVAVGVAVGLIILGSILLASYVSRLVLKRLSVMYFPKRALSMLMLAIFVFAGLTVAAALDLTTVQNLSIFPVLILTLLGDSIISVQLYKSFAETLSITVVTISLGLLGYMLAISQGVLNTIILYPELVLLTIPANILLGRYFGLRLTEFFRFEQID